MLPWFGAVGGRRVAHASRLYEIDTVLEKPTPTQAEQELAITYDQHAPLIRWLVAHRLPVPHVLHMTADATLRRRVLANLRAPGASFVWRPQYDEPTRNVLGTGFRLFVSPTPPGTRKPRPGLVRLSVPRLPKLLSLKLKSRRGWTYRVEVCTKYINNL
jgi:hypothetical protein